MITMYYAFDVPSLSVYNIMCVYIIYNYGLHNEYELGFHIRKGLQ